MDRRGAGEGEWKERERKCYIRTEEEDNHEKEGIGWEGVVGMGGWAEDNN